MISSQMVQGQLPLEASQKMKNLSSQLVRRRGFTLIELLVVILILGILAALIVPKVIGQTDKAKIGAANADLATLSASLDNFRLDCGRYPSTDEGLQALLTPPSGLEGKWGGAYIKEIPNDPWGHPYVYKSPGSIGGQDSYTVESFGASGQEGGPDNIVKNG
jgi:general secretion pathway protein G